MVEVRGPLFHGLVMTCVACQGILLYKEGRSIPPNCPKGREDGASTKDPKDEVTAVGGESTIDLRHMQFMKLFLAGNSGLCGFPCR